MDARYMREKETGKRTAALNLCAAASQPASQPRMKKRTAYIQAGGYTLEVLSCFYLNSNHLTRDT